MRMQNMERLKLRLEEDSASIGLFSQTQTQEGVYDKLECT